MTNTLRVKRFFQKYLIEIGKFVKEFGQIRAAKSAILSNFHHQASPNILGFLFTEPAELLPSGQSQTAGRYFM